MIATPSEEPGKRKALIFTLSVHGLLILALFFGVQWKRSAPEVMEVELWSSRPTPAMQAPPPPPPEETRPEPKPEPKPEPRVEPKPEPKKPDIALKEEKKKPEPKKPEPAKPEPKKPEPPKPEPKKPEAKPAPQPPVDPFKEMLEREQKQLKAANNQAQMKAAADAEQRAAAGQRGLATWSDKIRSKIRNNIVQPQGLTGNPVAVFSVTQIEVTGEIIDVRLDKSSGNPAYDAAIERAIRKSSPLPKPDDPSASRRIIGPLTFCPDQDRGCR